jgi:oligopeptide transport system substrate-binding protein
MYEANELDLTGPPLEEMDRVKTDPVLSKELYIAPRDCTYYYGFTTNKPPVDDVLVRKALSAAVDRQGLIDNVTKGNQLPANTFAPAMIFGNAASDPDIAPWALDYEMGKEQAKAWLAEAGYPDGEGFPTITLMHNTSEGHAKIAQAIAAMWQDVLGIEVTVENQEWKVYLQTIEKDTPLEEAPHVWRMGWCADYPDQNNWVHEVFNAEEGANDARAVPSKFEELTKAAQVETDPEARKALYKEAEKILNEEEARILPIYYYTTVALTKPWVTYRTYGEMGGTSWFTWKVDWAAKKAALGM